MPFFRGEETREPGRAFADEGDVFIEMSCGIPRGLWERLGALSCRSNSRSQVL